MPNACRIVGSALVVTMAATSLAVGVVSVFWNLLLIFSFKENAMKFSSYGLKPLGR